MATSYRRNRTVTHRAPWSRNTESLNPALTINEASQMWKSFDNEDDSERSSRGWETPFSTYTNRMTTSDPGEDPGLVLRSSPKSPSKRDNKPAVARRRLALADMRKTSTDNRKFKAVWMDEPAALISALHCCPVHRKDWDVSTGIGLMCDLCKGLCRSHGEWCAIHAHNL